MRQILPFCCVVFLLATSPTFAQAEKDSIILLNGKVYREKVVKVDEDYLTVESFIKGDKLELPLERYRIFSYTQNGEETVLYTENAEADNFLTVNEARNATLGSYDARQTFKPRVVFWSSLALGYGASLYDTYLDKKSLNDPEYIGDETSPGFFKSRPSLAPILVPLVLTATWAIPSFKLREKQMIQLHLKNDESYYRGYHRVAKQKRMLAALRGGLIGVGAGILTYAIFK